MLRGPITVDRPLTLQRALRHLANRQAGGYSCERERPQPGVVSCSYLVELCVLGEGFLLIDVHGDVSTLGDDGGLYREHGGRVGRRTA